MKTKTDADDSKGRGGGDGGGASDLLVSRVVKAHRQSSQFTFLL